MFTQEQFLTVVDRDEAERKFQAALRLGPLGVEEALLDEALGRVLARDVIAPVDVPSFDRSNYDGFAVRAADTYGAREESPRRVALLDEVLPTGAVPKLEVSNGTASAIATGGMLPRGADAVVMVEHAEKDRQELIVRRAVAPGFGVTFTGTDIAAGETVLWRGTELTSRETGVLAAIGMAHVAVYRRVKVAILSTGDELIQPGQPMHPAMVYDSNARILADAIREQGGVPISLGIARDDFDLLHQCICQALEAADVILVSGGTSKGGGDLSYRVVEQIAEPGIIAHGVALKPGKPICLAAHRGKAVVILPGFPTSAIFTYHEFVAPVIRSLGGRPASARSMVRAKLAVKINSEIGRTEYLLVRLTRTGIGDGELAGLIAYPMGQGSGSVTAFSRADGFVTIGRHEEILSAGKEVDVQPLGRETRAADLMVIGSHCVGLDYLLGRMQDLGFQVKAMMVGSTAGLAAAERGECDVAGIHLLDPATGQYNRPFVSDRLELVAGYGRQQGVLYRRGDERFAGKTAVAAVTDAASDPCCVMVNRNQGSGTRILIDRVLEGAQPAGYAVQARNHNAVAAAIAQSRADWGVAIESVARARGLGFVPLQDEQYDFVVPKSRTRNPAVVAFSELLSKREVRCALREMGFNIEESHAGW